MLSMESSEDEVLNAGDASAIGSAIDNVAGTIATVGGEQLRIRTIAKGS